MFVYFHGCFSSSLLPLQPNYNVSCCCLIGNQILQSISIRNSRTDGATQQMTEQRRTSLRPLIPHFLTDKPVPTNNGFCTRGERSPRASRGETSSTLLTSHCSTHHDITTSCFKSPSRAYSQTTLDNSLPNFTAVDGDPTQYSDECDQAPVAHAQFMKNFTSVHQTALTYLTSRDAPNYEKNTSMSVFKDAHRFGHRRGRQLLPNSDVIIRFTSKARTSINISFHIVSYLISEQTNQRKNQTLLCVFLIMRVQCCTAIHVSKTCNSCLKTCIW